MQKKSVITSTGPHGQTGYKNRQVKLQEQVTGTDGLTATIKYMIVLLPAYCSLATNAQVHTNLKHSDHLCSIWCVMRAGGWLVVAVVRTLVTQVRDSVFNFDWLFMFLCFASPCNGAVVDLSQVSGMLVSCTCL